MPVSLDHHFTKKVMLSSFVERWAFFSRTVSSGQSKIEANCRTPEILTADIPLLTSRMNAVITHPSDKLGRVGIFNHGAGGVLYSPVVIYPAEMWDALVKFFCLHRVVPKEETE